MPVAPEAAALPEAAVEVEPEDHFLLFEGLLAVNTGGYISIIRVEQK